MLDSYHEYLNRLLPKFIVWWISLQILASLSALISNKLLERNNNYGIVAVSPNLLQYAFVQGLAHGYAF